MYVLAFVKAIYYKQDSLDPFGPLISFMHIIDPPLSNMLSKLC